LLANQDAIEAMTAPTVILDVSVCPPRGLDATALVHVQDSGVPAGDVSFNESGPDTLLIIPHSHLSCFVESIRKLSVSPDDLVSFDLAACGD
jgi:hypothetical protein